ncbi:hypothetical protein IQ25_04098 [Novosphingobium taihuense]|nr:hypothetical protein IQ25_04098 [Novosphingobium taihuense]
MHKGSYRKLLTDIPDVQLGHMDQYMVFGHDACMRVLMDPKSFRNHDVFKHSLGKSFGRTITVMDAPEHGRFLKVFQKAFLPQVVRQWGESIVDPVVDALMGKLID